MFFWKYESRYKYKCSTSVLITDVVIDNIISETGATFGISIWSACEVTIEGDIKISNIQAGTKVKEDAFGYSDRPNKAPAACGFDVWCEWDDVTTETTEDNAEYNIDTNTINGHVGCVGSDTIDDHNSEDDFYSVVTTLSSLDYDMWFQQQPPGDQMDESGDFDHEWWNEFERGAGAPNDRRFFVNGQESASANKSENVNNHDILGVA